MASGYYPQGYGAPPADPYAYPAYAPYPTPAVYGNNPDEVRTMFISGFPDDVKERELNNLLRFLPGYEASQMNWKNDQAQGFALFASGMQARSALESINQLMFDDQAVLRAEMAHKNMYVKDDSNPTKRPRTAMPPAVPMGPPMGVPVHPGTYGAQPYGAGPNTMHPPHTYLPVTNQRDNPPCNTLFIGNLGDRTDEAELRQLFEGQPGFSQMKAIRNERGVTVFVEFADVASAVACHQSQQGVMLNSSDRGGVRIQYSKNPFGKKRDRDVDGYGGGGGGGGGGPPQHSGGYGSVGGDYPPAVSLGSDMGGGMPQP